MPDNPSFAVSLVNQAEIVKRACFQQLNPAKFQKGQDRQNAPNDTLSQKHNFVSHHCKLAFINISMETYFCHAPTAHCLSICTQNRNPHPGSLPNGTSMFSKLNYLPSHSAQVLEPPWHQLNPEKHIKQVQHLNNNQKVSAFMTIRHNFTSNYTERRGTDRRRVPTSTEGAINERT